jgi:hypothetical protein
MLLCELRDSSLLALQPPLLHFPETDLAKKLLEKTHLGPQPAGSQAIFLDRLVPDLVLIDLARDRVEPGKISTAGEESSIKPQTYNKPFT